MCFSDHRVFANNEGLCGFCVCVFVHSEYQNMPFASKLRTFLPLLTEVCFKVDVVLKLGLELSLGWV